MSLRTANPPPQASFKPAQDRLSFRMTKTQISNGKRLIVTPVQDSTTVLVEGDALLYSLRGLSMGEGRNTYKQYDKLNKDLDTLSLKTDCYPSEEVLLLKGKENDRLKWYIENIMKPTHTYLQDSYIIYTSEHTSTAYLHGGLNNFEREHMHKFMYFNGSVPTEIRLEECLEYARTHLTGNDIHLLGFNEKSPITGRLLPSEDASIEDAFAYMHPDNKFTVVGHTPQSLGIPTIIKHLGKYLIILDTQYSDRKKNNHCLAMCTYDKGQDQEFVLKGTWTDKEKSYEYEALSRDMNIGTKWTDKEGTAYRVVARITDGEKAKQYIGIRYDGFTGSHTLIPFLGRGPEFYKITDYKIHQITCGDIEASKSFLCGFLRIASVMIGYKDVPNDHQLPYKIDLLSELIQKEEIEIVCIGDVIGDPLGRYDGKDEKRCIDWANKYAKHKIAGNRDINKLRLVPELLFAQRHPALVRELTKNDNEKLSKAEKEKTSANGQRAQEILTRMTYPFSKESDGNWKNLHTGKTVPKGVDCIIKGDGFVS